MLQYDNFHKYHNYCHLWFSHIFFHIYFAVGCFFGFKLKYKTSSAKEAYVAFATLARPVEVVELKYLERPLNWDSSTCESPAIIYF